jgi:hypothetical protein
VVNSGRTSELKQTVSDFTVGIGFTTTTPVLSPLMGCIMASWVQDNAKTHVIARRIEVFIN